MPRPTFKMKVFNFAFYYKERGLSWDYGFLHTSDYIDEQPQRYVCIWMSTRTFVDCTFGPDTTGENTVFFPALVSFEIFC